MSEALWPQLLSSALVGTQRRPCRPSALDGPVAAVLPATQELDADGVLQAAAVISVVRRAAVTAATVELPPVAPPEVLEAVPERAGNRLGRLVSDGGGGDQRSRRALLREWLELAAERRLLAPPRHLVALTELATGDHSLRPLVGVVGGVRLTWLAAAGPGRWAWVDGQAAEPPGLADWQTGAAERRIGYLELLRANDPAAGRILLGEVWAQEKAADLAGLIRACATGLGPDDEAWLEKALDDRRTQVRDAAAELLAVLPGSVFRLRMAERALACVRVGGRGRLAVTPPAELDAAMKRDGLSPKPPHGMGERAWLLLQVISAAPLDCWSTLDADPAALIERKVNDDWSDILRQGWLRAATVQRDAVWALRLWRLPQARGVLAELMAVLMPAQQAAVATEALKRASPQLAELVNAVPAPWPAELTEAVLMRLGRAEKTEESNWWQLVTAVERKLDPPVAPRVAAMRDDGADGRRHDALSRLAATLEIRSDIHQEFA